MTIIISGGRAGFGRRDGLMMVRRFGSFNSFLWLETLPVQDGKHGGNYGELYFCSSFIFTKDEVSLRP